MKHEHRSSQNSFGKQSDFYIMNWQQKHENSLKKWANHATWWKLAQADNTIQEHLSRNLIFEHFILIIIIILFTEKNKKNDDEKIIIIKMEKQVK
jgi:hypothetical protein